MTQHPDPGRTYGQEPRDPHTQGQPYGSPQGYPQPGRPHQAYGSAPGPLDGEERTMMLLAHLSAPAAFLLSAGWMPFLGPLLIWLFYKDKSQAVRRAAAGAFNFNITMTIASVALWISVFLTLGVGFLWAVPGWILLFLIQLWAHVRGAIKATNGAVYDYPFQIRLLQ